jgi:cell fate (sporulation/competence/biofilm development) regulator YmcA (YheA/YmcA/DUF963 family)
LGDRGFIFLDSVMPVENQVAQCQVIEWHFVEIGKLQKLLVFLQKFDHYVH